jgi:hypothetical protein
MAIGPAITRHVRLGARVAAALLLALPAAPSGAASFHVYASALVHDYPLWQADSEFEVLDSEGDPIAADARAGYVIDMYHPDLRTYIDGTLFAEASARADFGTNGVRVASNMSAVTGNDRGDFPTIELVGGTMRVETTTESSWSDLFVITGGTGVDVASVDILLSGFAETRYGANGDVWYAAGLQDYGTGGSGTARYGLDIDYASLPEGVDEEYSNPIRWEENYSPPVPAYVQTSGPLPGTLTGTFVFEYGVPFSLTSSLGVSGYSQITIDFDHTASLSQFVLPSGASLTSDSGHLYPVSVVPEPAPAWLLASGLLVLAGASRERPRWRRARG